MYTSVGKVFYERKVRWKGMILKYRVKPSFMHTKKASKNNIALQKKKFFSTFKMACLDCYVGEMSSKSCFFFEKRNSHFCLEARKCDKSNLE